MRWSLLPLFLLGLYWVVSGMLKWKSMRSAAVNRSTLPVVACNSRLQEIVRRSRFRWVEYVPCITYTYRVDGVDIQGSRIYLAGEISHTSREKILQFIEHLAPMAVHVKSDDPQDAVLIPKPSDAWRASVRGTFGSGAVLVMATTVLFFLLR